MDKPPPPPPSMYYYLLTGSTCCVCLVSSAGRTSRFNPDPIMTLAVMRRDREGTGALIFADGILFNVRLAVLPPELDLLLFVDLLRALRGVSACSLREDSSAVDMGKMSRKSTPSKQAEESTSGR